LGMAQKRPNPTQHCDGARLWAAVMGSLSSVSPSWLPKIHGRAGARSRTECDVAVKPWLTANFKLPFAESVHCIGGIGDTKRPEQRFDKSGYRSPLTCRACAAIEEDFLRHASIMKLSPVELLKNPLAIEVFTSVVFGLESSNGSLRMSL